MWRGKGHLFPCTFLPQERKETTSGLKGRKLSVEVQGRGYGWQDGTDEKENPESGQQECFSKTDPGLGSLAKPSCAEMRFGSNRKFLCRQSLAAALAWLMLESKEKHYGESFGKQGLGCTEGTDPHSQPLPRGKQPAH